ncbi:hypothetical protein BCA33_15295 [Marinobacter sp. AC-23]|nr:hypothetical protein BCA33_15295 [Marinobacter sp. AC-23]
MEPFFASLMIVFSAVFDDVFAVFLFFSFIQAVLIFKIVGKMHHGVFFFSSYILIFYVSLNLNVLRAGLALLLFIQSLLFCKTRKGGVYLVLALATHVSVFALLPLYLIRSKARVRDYFFVILTCAVFGWLAWIFMGDYLIFKIQVYVLDIDSGFHVSVSMIALIFFGFFMLLLDRNFSSEAIFAYVIMMVWMVLTTKFSVFHRFYQMAFLVFLFLVFEKRVFRFSEFKVRPFSVYAMLLVIYFTVSTAIGMLNEGQRVYDSGKGDFEYTIVPYSLFWLDN